MKILQGKNIVLGITGGIAAYKAPELVRRLKDHGADVRTVLTQSAHEFVTPLSLQAVSANPVSNSLLDPQAELAMGHIELAKWADAVLIAPATANTIAKITHGLADDLLSTICLATSALLIIAPAMNQQMWHATATQNNIATLTARGGLIWGPGAGEQACGDVGLGRMLDVADIVSLMTQFFSKHDLEENLPLRGQEWVITAGPTREAIDPVRYISNHSSGKMGFAIAQAAQQAGANVTIISGPVTLPTPQHCQRIDVSSATEMHQHALAQAKSAAVFVGCAAVADYRVANIAKDKIKKAGDEIQLTLTKNPDIIADVAAATIRPFMVGFAAETQDVEQYAQAKLVNKKLDLIAANNVAIAGQGFNSDDNALTVYSHSGRHELPLGSKADLAQQLVTLIEQYINKVSK